MGRLVDDFNRLDAAAAQGKVLLNAGRRVNTCVSEAKCTAADSSGKARTVSRHTTADFVSKHYDVVRDIGRGSFSRVTLVRDRQTGRERVCKVVDTREMSPEALELTKAEIDVLAVLDYPCIVRLDEYAIDVDRHKLVLILEHVPGGDCCGLISKSGRGFDEGFVARLIRQLLAATNYCHTRGIMHRDVKPQNMMLSKAPSAWDTPELKMIDFGLATCSKTSRDFVGTPAYMAPEVLHGSADYTSQVDLWSIGCTTVELLVGKPPFGVPEDFDGDMTPVFNKVKEFREFDEVAAKLDTHVEWKSLGMDAKDFVERLLQRDPGLRMSAKQALNHPWILRHTHPQAGLGTEIVRSLKSYSIQSLLIRHCMFIIATRAGASECRGIGRAFVDGNASCTGTMSREEFVEALSYVSVCGWSQSNVDPRSVFEALTLGRTSRQISYSEFAGACLFGQFKGDLGKIAEETFYILDSNRDGNVAMSSHIRPFFGDDALKECESWFPPEETVDVDGWRSFVEQAGHRGLAHESWISPPVNSADFPRSLLMDFVRSFMCEQILCSACESVHQAADDTTLADAPVVLCHDCDPNFEELPGTRETCRYAIPDVPTRRANPGTGLNYEVFRRNVVANPGRSETARRHT